MVQLSRGSLERDAHGQCYRKGRWPAGELHGLSKAPSTQSQLGAWLRAVDGGGSTGLLGIVSASPSRKTGPGSIRRLGQGVCGPQGLNASFLGPPADPEILP